MAFKLSAKKDHIEVIAKISERLAGVDEWRVQNLRVMVKVVDRAAFDALLERAEYDREFDLTKEILVSVVDAMDSPEGTPLTEAEKLAACLNDLPIRRAISEAWGAANSGNRVKK